MIVDSHCHLDFPDFADELDAVIARAHDAGVGAMLTICTRISCFAQVAAVADQYENIYCTVGVHPHEAEAESPFTPDQLLILAEHPKVIGLGETGLDYFYDHSPRQLQQECFRAHIQASRQSGLPVIIHSRDADEDMLAILREEYQEGAFPAVLHCFSSGAALAEGALELGFYISLSGIVTFKSADELREITANVPLNRILVETDAPYLSPIPMRGRRNEPAFTRHTADVVAGIKGLSTDELARATTENFFRLFAIKTNEIYDTRAEASK